MSLRWRIAAGLGVIAVLVSAFGATAAYLSTSQRLLDGVDASMVASAEDLDRDGTHGGFGPSPSAANTANTTTPAANGAERGGGGFERPEGCPPAGMFQPAAAAQRIASDGTVTQCIEGGPALPVSPDDERLARHGRGNRIETVSIEGQDYRVLTVASNGGAYQIARSLDEIDGVLASLRTRLLLIGAAGVAAAVLLGWLVARRVVKPVDELRDTAEQIAATQDLSTPIPSGGAAEIGSLARSFTTMVDALDESRREQQQLVSDASHELRTPLTSLKTNAELLARADELDPAEFHAVVQGVQLEVDELTNLVSELVELATEPSAAAEPPEFVDLGEHACAVARRAQRRSGRAVEVLAADDAAAAASTVFVAPQLVERALGNLVENALKYSPPDTTIEIAVVGTSVEVRDRGPGIAHEDLPHVFDRFYRSVAARTEPGSGLGLAIVKQIVQRNAGRVWAANRDGGGAVVGFELPPAP